MKKLSCAFVTHYPMPDLRAFSGVSYFLSRHLERAGIDVQYVHATPPTYTSLSFRLRRKFYKKVFGWGMREDREPWVMKRAARELDEKLKNLKFDFIFSPGSLAVSYLQNNKPKFFWSDATFAGYIDFAPEFTNMSPETIYKGNRLEQNSIDNCAAVFYCSDWAAQTALNYYKASPDKVKVISFGANFDEVPDQETFQRIIENKFFKQCRLVFYGGEWERKGGSLVLRVVEELVRRGTKVSLDIIGCNPLIPDKLRDCIIAHGFISKKTKEGSDKISSLLQQSHFLILPAQQDASALAFCEAAAFGVPGLGSRVGGSSTIIRDGVNGQLFQVGVDPGVICDYIQTIFSNVSAYLDLARRTRGEFETRLNWTSSVAAFLEQIKKYI